MQLRQYQQNLINKTIEAVKKGNRRVLICLPTGGGKTAISSELIKRCYAKGNKSIFCCHRQELLKQTANTYRKNGLEPAFVKSGLQADVNNPCQIASINTLVNRLSDYTGYQVIVMDEAHHQASNTWAKISSFYDKSIIIGLSATPCRMDGKPLSDYFDCMVQEITTKELIEQGYLVPYKYYAPTELDESMLVLGSNGEYTKDSVNNTVMKSKIIGNNIEHYKNICAGKRNVIFAASITHGKKVCEEYNAAGIRAEFLDGNTDTKLREETLVRFATGDTKVLVNVDLFGEGFDLPAIEVVSLLRPTHSLALYLQQVGRALRTCQELGKTEAIILDHVNNYQRHGLPDEERIWTLDGKAVRKRGDTEKVAIKRCPVCFYAHKPALVCPNCGHVYQAEGKTIKEINGKLVLIGSVEEQEEQKREIRLANTLEDLVRIEDERGYKTGWAERQYQFKTGENLWASYSGLRKIQQARGYNRGWIYAMQKVRKG